MICLPKSLKNALFLRQCKNYMTHSRGFGIFGPSNLPPFKGEEPLKYLPGSAERAALKHALSKMYTECPEIPCVVNGEEIKTGQIKTQIMPSLHSHAVCKYHVADKDLINKAIECSLKAKKEWEAAEIISQRRAEICAAVMVGTGKNVWQAEIDAACETLDFLRFIPTAAHAVLSSQPPLHSRGAYNRLEHRPLEGFVAAITPFNFNAIGLNLAASPVFMGNAALWKPSSSSILGNFMAFRALERAGLPPGIINFLPCADGAAFGAAVLASPHLAGVHFTGSSATFERLWGDVAANLRAYRNYPRVVGETGGKNFHLAHISADPERLLSQSIRAAFEYSGQKCSALSRLYVPQSLWDAGFGKRLADEVAAIKVGQPDDFDVFVTAVISQRAFDRAKSYVDWARADEGCEILAGGRCDDSQGYFVHPTVVRVTDPRCRLMTEEIFAPVLAVHVYPDAEWDGVLRLCDESQYALTGAVFARDRTAVRQALGELLHSAGNVYVNDKCTGAVVGQQPFGGSRRSGTNDKAGSALNLVRWVSPRTVKESFEAVDTYKYPHMA